MNTATQEWEAYVESERALLTPILTARGYTLDETQPHLKGERYLQQAISSTSGPKIILIGKRASDNARVVIKATTNKNGAAEIEHERLCRTALTQIVFAYRTFYAPTELDYFVKKGMTVSVQEFIEQDSTFLERPLAEQFAIALNGFKIQEGAHATTYGHLKRISKIFPIWKAKDYLLAAEGFGPSTEAFKALTAGTRQIEQYCGFLTHSDFVPHNIRVRDNKLYLLDHSAIRFGNKYEGWARFINFMVLYNPPLADALLAYVRENRTPEESESLRLMRIYRLVEILAYYRGVLSRSEGNLLDLNQARISFWSEALQSILNNSPLNTQIREQYIQARDSLRSEDEKRRQIGLH